MEMKLHNEDCILQMQKMIDEGIQVDSVVTDPPYELGFMGKSWDSTGIAFQKETWKLAFQLLKPGGHLLAFAGSRTYHRIAVAVEDAGFEIRDQIMWLYGSGFPKSLNIGKAIDKKLGNKYEGWGTALKPAHEPIVMARKPAEGTIAENVLKYGTGGINIDDCRIIGEDNPVKWKTPRGGIWKTDPNAKAELVENELGRFPANVMHDGLVQEWARFFYCPKVSRDERNRGLDNFEDKFSPTMGDGIGEKPQNPETGTKKKNIHPTIKPVELMKYLCRLVTPKGGTILDPFMGSGSTGMAAKDEGFEFIGIEKEKEYFEIAESRIKTTAPLTEFMS